MCRTGMLLHTGHTGAQGRRRVADVRTAALSAETPDFLESSAVRFAVVGSVAIRTAGATERDRRRLAALRRAWAEEDAGGPIDDAGYEDRAIAWVAAHEGTRLAWLAEIDGAPVGMLVLVSVERMPRPGRLGSGWGYVHHFGHQLMAAAVEEADARGWPHLLLDPRPSSVPFYRRWGFTPAEAWLARHRQ